MEYLKIYKRYNGTFGFVVSVREKSKVSGCEVIQVNPILTGSLEETFIKTEKKIMHKKVIAKQKRIQAYLEYLAGK